MHKCKECIHDGVCGYMHLDDTNACCNFEEPRKHGHFIYEDKMNADIIAKCSCCGKYTLISMEYCGKCGAHMDGKDESDGTRD